MLGPTLQVRKLRHEGVRRCAKGTRLQDGSPSLCGAEGGAGHSAGRPGARGPARARGGGVHEAGQLSEGVWVWLPGSRQGKEEGPRPSGSRASRLLWGYVRKERLAGPAGRGEARKPGKRGESLVAWLWDPGFPAALVSDCPEESLGPRPERRPENLPAPGVGTGWSCRPGLWRVWTWSSGQTVCPRGTGEVGRGRAGER